MINNSFHPHVWFKDSRDVFMHNIVTAPYFPIRVPYWGKFVNHNFFSDSLALAMSQKNNTDQNSISGSLVFADPESGNFNVPDDSAALMCGFLNFDMDNFGVYSPALKAISKKVVFAVPVLSR